MINRIRLFSIFAVLALFISLSTDAFAQGKGKGNSGGKGKEKAPSTPQGRGNDDFWEGQDEKGKSKSSGQESRHKKSGVDSPQGNKQANKMEHRYENLGRKLNMSSSEARAWYERESALNPNLTYGNFVAANMIARNHQGISAQQILNGMRSGRSLGQTMKDLGVNDREIRKDKKRVKDDLKKHRKENDYDDEDDYRVDW